MQFDLMNFNLIAPKAVAPHIWLTANKKSFGSMLNQLFNLTLLLVGCLAVFLALRLGKADSNNDKDRQP
jgi:hypothetical protein